MCEMAASMLNTISGTVSVLVCKRRKVFRERCCFLKAASITAVRLPLKKKKSYFTISLGKPSQAQNRVSGDWKKSETKLCSCRQQSDMVNFTSRVASPVQDSAPCQAYGHGLPFTPAENPKHLLQSSLSFKCILDLCRCLVSYESGIFFSALYVNLSLLC